MGTLRQTLEALLKELEHRITRIESGPAHPGLFEVRDLMVNWKRLDFLRLGEREMESHAAQVAGSRRGALIRSNG